MMVRESIRPCSRSTPPASHLVTRVEVITSTPMRVSARWA
jgi:hypothetical protein